MERSLQIHKLVPVLIEPDQIGLDVEAALTENDEGVDFAVPNVTFEIRIGVQKVYEGKSDVRTGTFVATQIPLGKMLENFEVSVSATNEVGKISVRMAINITHLMKKIEEKCQREEKSRAELDLESKTPPSKEDRYKQLSDEAENQRRIKAEIKEALSLVNLSIWHGWPDKPSRRYFNIDEGAWYVSSLDRDLYSSEVKYNYSCRRLVDTGGFQDDDFYPGTNERTRRDLNEKLRDAFKVLVTHHEHPETIDGVKNAVNSHPKKFVDCLDLYVDTIWAEEIIAVIAVKMPKELIENLSKFSSKPWLINILTILVELEPGLLLTRFSDFSGRPWTRKIVLKVATDHPAVFFVRIEAFEHQPWAGELAIMAAERDPIAASKYFVLYKNQSWADDVFAFTREAKEK